MSALPPRRRRPEIRWNRVKANVNIIQAHINRVYTHSDASRTTEREPVSETEFYQPLPSSAVIENRSPFLLVWIHFNGSENERHRKLCQIVVYELIHSIDEMIYQNDDGTLKCASSQEQRKLQYKLLLNQWNSTLRSQQRHSDGSAACSHSDSELQYLSVYTSPENWRAYHRVSHECEMDTFVPLRRGDGSCGIRTTRWLKSDNFNSAIVHMKLAFDSLFRSRHSPPSSPGCQHWARTTHHSKRWVSEWVIWMQIAHNSLDIIIVIVFHSRNFPSSPNNSSRLVCKQRPCAPCTTHGLVQIWSLLYSLLFRLRIRWKFLISQLLQQNLLFIF